MRVRGQDASFSPDGTDDDAARNRRERFRRRRRPGQVVAGRVLGPAGEGLTWVDFDGAPLKARVAPETRPGTTLSFLILELSPDILLKEVAPPEQPFTGLDITV